MCLCLQVQYCCSRIHTVQYLWVYIHTKPSTKGSFFPCSPYQLLVIGSALCQMLQLPRLFQLLQTAPVFSCESQEDLSSLPSDKQRDRVGVKMMLPLVTDRERHRDSTHALYSFYLPLLFIVRGPSCDSSWCARSMWKAERLSLRK